MSTCDWDDDLDPDQREREMNRVRFLLGLPTDRQRRAQQPGSSSVSKTDGEALSPR